MDKLIYKRPAKVWSEALPLGNGSIGVMAFGGNNTEKLMFNDSTLWSGYPKKQDNPNSLTNLAKVRGLVFNGQKAEAQKLLESNMTGDYSESFMPLGELDIKILGNHTYNFRQLDIANSIFTVSQSDMLRECFVSFPNNIAIYKFKAKNATSFIINAKSKLKHNVIYSQNAISLQGTAPDFVYPNYVRTKLFPVKYTEGKGMAFCLYSSIKTDGNCVTQKGKIVVQNATYLELYSTTKTGYTVFDKMPCTDTTKVANLCKQHNESVSKNYENLKANHIADYKSLYCKQAVTLNAKTELYTDELLKSAKGGTVDNALFELLYNYGKYLMISSSRAGEAINLQGIWNKSKRPAWSSNYTANINVQMNYWMMSACGLEQCAKPYVDLIYKVMQHGKSTAQVNYGARGFACNHNTDIWAKTAPVIGNSQYMYAPLCGAWLANEIVSHYKYGNMQCFKDKILEILEQATLFALDYLVEYNGEYITCPSTSPELNYTENGKTLAIDYATSFELGIVKELFNNYVQLGANKGILQEVKQKLPKIRPFTHGDYGINEWHDCKEVKELGHRHFSPLYAFYPAKVIGYHSDKQQTVWVKKLFDTRISNNKWFVGWSAGWAICLAGRLHDSKTAKMIMDKMMQKSIFTNLFDIHPPRIFQIDGNLGFVAGVNELLITEENGIIELLPALPCGWGSGAVKNMRTQSGHSVSFAWQNGIVTELEIQGENIKLRKNNLSKDLLAKYPTV